MKIEKQIFTWYATHPRDGDLVMAVVPANYFKYCYIYAPRIIAERLKPNLNSLMALELSLGPMGAIPRRYYVEAGFTTDTPFKIRMIAILENSKSRPEESWLMEQDEMITAFILKEWQKNVIDVR